ncbi:unnamed protein product [Linum tenue]|uniref:Uncharacterized protein n=1 Tax=Linum tenue TaxID=586396 RepID=A0AAV0M925_9ROSI|nr:unnamed protein product [Linum tenue]
MAAVEEIGTVNLVHQPSAYDSEEEEETLSLRDLPLTTATTSSSSRSIAWDESHHDHDHEQDVFEFFNPSSSTCHDEENQDKGSIMFCGKIIPHRKPHQGNNNSTDETSTIVNSKNNFNRRRSSSHNEPRPAEYYSRQQQVKRLWSLPLPRSPRPPLPSAARVSMKSRWYVLAFGAGKFPAKMELDDMKFRQSKKLSSSMKPDDEGRNRAVVKKVEGSRNKKSLWPGLLGVLGCSGEEGSRAMVKASFVCMPLPTV